jgi:hypothetical protein
LADTVSSKVLQRLGEVFKGAEQDAVRAILLQYHSASAELNERVYLDILRICEGKISKVRQLTDLAITDYRDLILAAEYDVIEGKYVLKAGLKDGWWAT